MTPSTLASNLVHPEFLSYLGDSGIALGNAVGSAIANIGLIVSITAILAPISVDLVPFKRRSLWMLITTVLVVILSWDFEVSRLAGLILVLSALVYLILNCVKAISERKKTPAAAVDSSQESSMSLRKSIMNFAIGTVLVIVGSRFLVSSSVAIATALKIPSLIIGLTAVAVGTSLPELITAIKSAKKKVADLSISNIIGANILNLGLITGVSAIIRPLTLDLFTRYYAFTWVFIMIIAMMLIFWKTGKMTKRAGIFMISLYALYVLGLMIFSLIQQA